MSAESDRNTIPTKTEMRINKFFNRTHMSQGEREIFFGWIKNKKFPKEMGVLRTESKALLGQFSDPDNPEALNKVGEKQKRTGQTVNKHLIRVAIKIDRYFHPD